MQQRLSPLQMRFVRMLEMNELEVEDEVRRELDDNPALEEAHTSENEAESTDFNETAEQMQLADYRDEDDIPSYRLEARNHSADDPYYEPVAVAGGDSMMDSLMSQLAETNLNEREMAIARYIIGNLDDNGYMTRTLPQIADDLAFNVGIDVPEAELRHVYATIRELDPAGIGANDLRDCLSLQLKRMEPTPQVKLATEIVNHYFDVFSLRHFDRLQGLLGVTRDQLKEAVAVIRGLDPKPASRLSENDVDDRTRHVIPDFIVEIDQNERVTVTMPNNVPELAIESSFNLDSTAAPQDKSHREAEAFIVRKREEASDFIELLRLRRQTLMRVMEAIVKLQHEFFVTEDESRLRPMILKDVARLTGLGLSVISRATAGKYVATPSGIYPLKFFFNERVSDTDDTSSREILSAMREIIDAEDPREPLGDEALMNMLKERGYDIARRTVAKYRDRLGIPVARLRKKI